MDSGKLVVNSGNVIGQCIGNGQRIVQSFGVTPATQVSTPYFSLSPLLQQELSTEEYDKMCKEIQDVIDKYRKAHS